MKIESLKIQLKIFNHLKNNDFILKIF